MQRIMIIGQPGSGKSTLARALGARTGLPVIHMDRIYWQPGWILRGAVCRERMVEDVIAQERWIFEGGHSQSYDMRTARADLVIWLDRPVWVRFWRVLKRTFLHFGRARPDLPEGCPERLHAGTFEFWIYIWRTRRSGRDKMSTLFDRLPAGKPHARLSNDRSVAAFLEEFTATTALA